MSRGPFSGMEVVKVMVNSGIFEWVRTNGDHDSDARTVPVPLHDELSRGTPRDIASQAGAKDFDEFCDWIERNR